MQQALRGGCRAKPALQPDQARQRRLVDWARATERTLYRQGHQIVPIGIDDACLREAGKAAHGAK